MNLNPASPTKPARSLRRDLGSTLDPNPLAHKPADPSPIRQLHLADAQRRVDAVDEAAEVFGGQFPDFYVNGSAAFVDTHHAGSLDALIHWLMALDVEFDVLEPPVLNERLRQPSERVGRSLARVGG